MDGSVIIGVELDAGKFEQALLRLRQSAGQTAVKALQPVLQSLGSLSTAFSKSGGAGQGWASGLTGVFSQVKSAAAMVVPSLTAAGRNAGAGFLSGLLQMDGTGAGQVVAARVIAGFTSGGFSSAGYQAAAAMTNGLIAGGSGMAGAGAAMAARIRAAFSSGWYSVGYNISAGIASGVLGGSSLISSAAVSAARSALAAAKRALGVHSPSRVFRDQVGRMIPAGIAQGIAGQTVQVEKTIHMQSEKLVQAARQDVVPVMGALPSGTKMPVVSGKSEVQVTVETPLYLDGREMARASARYMGQQILWEAT